jgi:hypothetical protein
VNPDHYKVAGRERQGGSLAKNPKQELAVNRAATKRKAKKPRRSA